MKSEHRYRIRYDLMKELGSFSREEVEGHGGTDAFVFGSILHPADGSYSQTFWSVDGRKRDGPPLSDNELFKFWIMMGSSLCDPGRDLDEGKRGIVQMAWEMFREALVHPRAREALQERYWDTITPEDEGGDMDEKDMAIDSLLSRIPLPTLKLLVEQREAMIERSDEA